MIQYSEQYYILHIITHIHGAYFMLYKYSWSKTNDIAVIQVKDKITILLALNTLSYFNFWMLKIILTKQIITKQRICVQEI